jgi:hypothetical protein
VSGRSTKRQAHWSVARIHSPPKMPAGTSAVAFRSVFAFVVLQTCNKPHSAISRPVGCHACKLGLEGIVSKRKGSAYRSGRSPDWLKMKNSNAPAVKREAEEDWGKERWR